MYSYAKINTGKVLDRAIDVYRDRFDALLIAGFVLFGALAAVEIGFLVLAGVSVSASGGHTPPRGTILFLLLVYNVGLACVMAIYQAIVMRVTAASHRGERLSFAEALRMIAPSLADILIAGLLVWTVVAVVLLISGFVLWAVLHTVPFLLIFLLIFGSHSVLGPLLIFVSFLFPALWTFTRLSLTIPIVAIEGEHATSAMTRSFDITKGNALRMFVLYLLTAIVVGILVALMRKIGGALAVSDPQTGAIIASLVAYILFPTFVFLIPATIYFAIIGQRGTPGQPFPTPPSPVTSYVPQAFGPSASQPLPAAGRPGGRDRSGSIPPPSIPPPGSN